MQYYSVDEKNNEVLINTKQSCDWIDNVTPGTPKYSIIHDVDLPILTENQALIAVGERNSYTFKNDQFDLIVNNVLLTSKNLEIVEDHRGEKYFNTADGSEIEIKEIGALPDHITPIPRPSPFHKWNGSEWVEDQTAKDEAQKQENIAKLDYETQRTTKEIDTVKPAVDGGYADDEDIALLPLLNKYRYQLSKVPDQIGWPLEVDWPIAPEF